MLHQHQSFVVKERSCEVSMGGRMSGAPSIKNRKRGIQIQVSNEDHSPYKDPKSPTFDEKTSDFRDSDSETYQEDDTRKAIKKPSGFQKDVYAEVNSFEINKSKISFSTDHKGPRDGKNTAI